METENINVDEYVFHLKGKNHEDRSKGRGSMLVKDCGHKQDFHYNIADGKRAGCTYIANASANVPDVNANIATNSRGTHKW